MLKTLIAFFLLFHKLSSIHFYTRMFQKGGLSLTLQAAVQAANTGLFQTLGRDAQNQIAPTNSPGRLPVFSLSVLSVLLSGWRGSHLLHLVLGQNLPRHRLLKFNFAMIYHQVDFSVGSFRRWLTWLRCDSIPSSFSLPLSLLPATS